MEPLNPRRSKRHTAAAGLGLAACCFFLQCAGGGAAPAKNETPAVEPSSGYDSSATVLRGGSCEITLHAIPSGGGAVEFKVPQGPRHGSLSAPVRISRGGVRYTYTHGGSKSPASDSFGFRFKSGPGKAWATRTATVRILEPAPALETSPSSLQFGAVFLGTATRQTLRIRNSGGGTLRASLEAGQPWSIPPGLESLALAEGESLEVPVDFTPSATDTQKGLLKLEMPEATVRIPLEGEGRPGFLVGERASFEQVPGAPPIDVPVQNPTASPATLQIQAEKPLSCQPTLVVGPNSTATFRLAVEARHHTAASAKVALSDGTSSATLRVDLPPPPALLEWASPNATLDIGPIPFRHTARPEPELRNAGSTPARAALAPGGTGFALAQGQPQTLELQPGQSAKIGTLWILPGTPGPASATLTATHGGLSHTLELAAMVSEPPPEPAQKTVGAAGNSTAHPKRPAVAVLSQSAADELSKRLPRGIRVRVSREGGQAVAQISWEYPGPGPVEFWLEQKKTARKPAGLQETFANRFEVPDRLPQGEAHTGWMRVPGPGGKPRQAGNGTWEAAAAGLEPGYRHIRIATQSPPGGNRTDYSSFAVRVDPPPPNPLWKWIAAAIGVSSLAYLLRKKIPLRLGRPPRGD